MYNRTALPFILFLGLQKEKKTYFPIFNLIISRPHIQKIKLSKLKEDKMEMLMFLTAD